LYFVTVSTVAENLCMEKSSVVSHQKLLRYFTACDNVNHLTGCGDYGIVLGKGASIRQVSPLFDSEDVQDVVCWFVFLMLFSTV